MSQLTLRHFSALTTFHVKALAALLMVIDHVGLVYEVEWMRIAGRFSFPLFAWLLVQGAKHTRNWQKYEQRLLILALASQPFHALFLGRMLPLNAVFQLWLGLITVRLTKTRQMTPLLWIAFIGMATLAFDYSYYGILLICSLDSYPVLLLNPPRVIDYRANVVLWIAAFVGLHAYFAIIHSLQIFAVAFMFFLPLLHRIEKRGAKARWFYWFYPVHFIPLTFLKGF